MTTYDSRYTDWLGDAALTEQQRDRFVTAADAYYDLPLDRDPEDQAANQAEDDAALSAILQAILGPDTLAAAGARYRQAEVDLDGWVRASAVLGQDEVAIAEQSSYSRPTVRARLGKRQAR